MASTFEDDVIPAHSVHDKTFQTLCYRDNPRRGGPVDGVASGTYTYIRV